MNVNNITRQDTAGGSKLSDLPASVRGMKIDRENDEALAEYYASLVDDREENE
jgi:hypothetical protein